MSADKFPVLTLRNEESGETHTLNANTREAVGLPVGNYRALRGNDVFGETWLRCANGSVELPSSDRSRPFTIDEAVSAIEVARPFAEVAARVPVVVLGLEPEEENVAHLR